MAHRTPYIPTFPYDDSDSRKSVSGAKNPKNAQNGQNRLWMAGGRTAKIANNGRSAPKGPPRETIVRTWLITHYVSHCGGQAGRALAAGLGSFERTGSPITLSFKRGLCSGSTPIPQRAEASVSQWRRPRYPSHHPVDPTHPRARSFYLRTALW